MICYTTLITWTIRTIERIGDRAANSNSYLTKTLLTVLFNIVVISPILIFPLLLWLAAVLESPLCYCIYGLFWLLIVHVVVMAAIVGYSAIQ